MEQKKKGKMEKRPFVCVCEIRKERAEEREKESAIVRDGLAALEDASSLFLLRLRQENSSLARSRKRKEEKEKEEKEATDEWWERRKRRSRRSVYFFMVAGMRASKGLPSAPSFSISMRRATPSQTNWRSSTSE